MKTLSDCAKQLKRYYYALPAFLLASTCTFLAIEISDSRAASVDGTQTMVFLRHAEKPDGGLGQLNCQGLNRALNLASVLPERFGKADFVFAADPGRHVEEGVDDESYSYIRPLATITPSAIKLGLPINIDYGANDTSDLAKELMNDKYHNAVIYTAWSSGYLPELINEVAGRAVGQDMNITEDWESGDFDSLYVLTLTWKDGKASLLSRNVKQGLDNGHTSCPV